MSWFILVLGIVIGIMGASAYPAVAVKVNEGMLFMVSNAFEIITEYMNGVLQ